MKRKKIIIITVIIIFIIMLIPIRNSLWDGGTKEYKAILYKVIKVHRINKDSPTGYDEGTIIKILGKEVYNSVIVNTYVNALEKEDILDVENGLLFTINWSKTKNVPIQLNIYDNNKYILYTYYEACRPGVNCTMKLKYTKSIDGIYDYDVIKIIQNSRDADNLQFTNDNLSDYEIYTGKDSHMYITYDSNRYLKEFLKQIDINLKEYAKADYN